MIGMNTGNSSAAESPFGGIKESGYGKESGKDVAVAEVSRPFFARRTRWRFLTGPAVHGHQDGHPDSVGSLLAEEGSMSDDDAVFLLCTKLLVSLPLPSAKSKQSTCIPSPSPPPHKVCLPQIENVVAAAFALPDRR